MSNLLNKTKNLTPELKAEYEKVIRDCDEYTAEKINECIKKYKIRATETGNELSEAVPFNLMFKTEVGPTGHLGGYLRPETAQGIFLNFRRLIDYNNGKMPCAAAQVGVAFRNEIHPK